jgi:hypothetical protein
MEPAELCVPLPTAVRLSSPLMKCWVRIEVRSQVRKVIAMLERNARADLTKFGRSSLRRCVRVPVSSRRSSGRQAPASISGCRSVALYRCKPGCLPTAVSAGAHPQVMGYCRGFVRSKSGFFLFFRCIFFAGSGVIAAVSSGAGAAAAAAGDASGPSCVKAAGATLSASGGATVGAVFVVIVAGFSAAVAPGAGVTVGGATTAAGAMIGDGGGRPPADGAADGGACTTGRPEGGTLMRGEATVLASARW